MCEVYNHVPMCYCPEGMTGNAFALCIPIPTPPRLVSTPCQPSPCGSNSQCRVINQQAVCSCLPDFIGAPPSCRPECVTSSECTLNTACLQQKCRDPCPGSCGLNAECNVISHNPMCRCLPQYEGNPFIACQRLSRNFCLFFFVCHPLYLYDSLQQNHYQMPH